MTKNAKIIGNNEDFAKSILEAIKILAEPVKATLGPDGLPILLEKSNHEAFITKDGVTVADSIFLEDPVLNTMVQSVKEASKKTGEMVGDGTTTALVLSEAIIESGMKFIQSGLITPQALVREIKNVLPAIIKHLETLKRPVENEESIKFVAMIASNNDKEIADKVTEAIMRGGKDGLFMIEDGFGPDIVVKQIDGYQLMKGWASHKDFALRMLTDQLKQEVMFNNRPGIFLYNGEFTDLADFSDLVVAFNRIDTAAMKARAMGQLVIVAHAFSGQIRDYVARNNSQNGLPIMLVESEQMGTLSTKALMLDDVAVLTGGQVVQHGNVKSIIERITPTEDAIKDGYIGRCQSVRQLKNSTTIYGGEGTQEKLHEHLDVIRKQIDDSDNWWDKQNHRKRLARLINGLVTIEVGGLTPLEIKEKKDRVDDAVHATKAAIQEGVVPGGGVALLRCSMLCDAMLDNHYGAMVLSKTLQAPIRQIISNTGESPDFVVYEILSAFDSDATICAGYNALKRNVEKNIYDVGIIDPFLVVKTALNNAVSIGCEIIRGGGYCVYKYDTASTATEGETL